MSFTSLRDLLVVYLPGTTGQALRRWHYRRRLRSMGLDVVIEVGVQLVNPEYMTLGDNCWIDRYAVLLAGPPRVGGRKIGRRENERFRYAEGELVVGANTHIAPHTVVSAHGGVVIGRNTTIAAGARIYSFSHHYRNPNDPDDTFAYRFSSQAPDHEQALISAPVVIEDNAAVTLNCIVLPGSLLGRDSWLNPASVLQGTIPPGCIAAGSPAKPVGPRTGAEELPRQSEPDGKQRLLEDRDQTAPSSGELS